MSTNHTITVPTPDALRATIRARRAELRTLRGLLRLAETAQAVPVEVVHALLREKNPGQEAVHVAR